MGRFKRWLVQHFLPAWAKETVLEENKRLERELTELCTENARLRAYADGLELGLYAARVPKQIAVRCVLSNNKTAKKGGGADGPCKSLD